MKLIFIYGPPSTGKYTTGKELARITGFRFFHNHVTVNALRTVFTGNTRPTGLLMEIRRMILHEAAKAGIDTIFTLAYSGAVDDDFVKGIVDDVESYGGEVCFVQLYTPKEELLKRINNESRKEIGKMSTKKELLETLATRDQYAAVKYKNNLRIDTTKSPAKKSAQTIVKHFGLE